MRRSVGEKRYVGTIDDRLAGMTLDGCLKRMSDNSLSEKYVCQRRLKNIVYIFVLRFYIVFLVIKLKYYIPTSAYQFYVW